MPSLVQAYVELDRRYSMHDPIVVLVSLCEMLVMAPMCFALYYAIHTRAPWRHPLQLVLCTCTPRSRSARL